MIENPNPDSLKIAAMKLSVSSIKTYESCPRKYKFRYKDHLPSKSWPHLALGNFVHEVLEKFHNILTVQPIEEWPTLMSEACKEKAVKFSLSMDQVIAAKNMLKQYLALLRDEGLPDIIANEQDFSIQLDENTIIRGYIDRIDHELKDEFDDNGSVKTKDLYHIVDYKSGKSKYLDQFQLIVYGLYLLDKDPSVTEFSGSYLMLAEDMKKLSYKFTLKDTNEAKQKILDTANKIRTDLTWEVKPTFLCSFCDYTEHCPEGSNFLVRIGRSRK